MYVGGTYARLVYSWYQFIFVIAVLIVFHAANKKNRMKTILKKDSNSRQRQDIVPVRNLKARKIKTLLSLPIHLDHLPITAAAFAPLLLRCCSAFAPLSLRCCSAVAPISLLCRSAVAPLPLMSLLLSLRCLSCYHSCCCSAVAPLSFCCRSAIAQLSLRCRFCFSVAAAVALAVATLSLLLSLLLSLHCHFCCCSDVVLVSLRYCSIISPISLCCCSAAAAVTPAVAPAIAPAVTPLLLLGLFTVVASRGRIRVTISDKYTVVLPLLGTSY